MKFEQKLISGKILKRYKRFLADIELDNGQIVTAHCPNSGRMTSCWEEGWKVLISKHDKPSRKLKYTWELSFNGETWILINTHRTNKLAKFFLENKEIPELAKYDNVRPEIKINEKSRLDFLLSSKDEKCYVEVKSVTLKGKDGFCEFPDAPTKRGRKHIKELIELRTKGKRAILLFIVQREDCNKFRPSEDIDKKYACLLKEANDKGVEILAYQTKLSDKEIVLNKKLEIFF